MSGAELTFFAVLAVTVATNALLVIVAWPSSDPPRPGRHALALAAQAVLVRRDSDPRR